MDTKIPLLERLIEIYTMCCKTEGMSPKTIEWYEANLRRLNQFLRHREHSERVEDIDLTVVREFIYHLQNDVRRWEDSPYIHDVNKLSPFSVQGYARSIKAFWFDLSPVNKATASWGFPLEYSEREDSKCNAKSTQRNK